MSLPPNRLTRPLDELIAEVDNDWAPLLHAWRASPAGDATVRHVDARVAAGAVVYPAQPFRALKRTSLARTRVVLLGQDPYHGAGQAEGLAFSVPAGCKLPPSLRNIFKELQRDLGLPMPASGHLGAWADRGVLLLNAVLTVEDGLPASHAKLGWEALTDAVIEQASHTPPPKVFLLWGAHAQAKRSLVDGAVPGHRVLACNHPSPLSAGRPPVPFAGCGHFGEARRFLAAVAGGAPFDWSL